MRLKGEKCYPSVGSVPEPINTITMYLGKAGRFSAFASRGELS